VSGKLWIGPKLQDQMALLVGGVVVIGVIVGRRRRTARAEASDTLSAEERQRLDSLLDKNKDD
jgi:cytochrome c-type biogenesis protein CcmH